MEPADLTPNVLMRLTGQALLSYLGSAARLEARVSPGLWLVLTGEPVTDLNFIVAANHAPGMASEFESYVAVCDEQDLPFAAILGPDVSGELAQSCQRLELLHAVAWPLMVCPASEVEVHPVPGLEVGPVGSVADMKEAAAVLAASFSLPVGSIRRAVPFDVTGMPEIEIYIARRDGKAVSTVTVIRHDRVAGVWAMGTLPDAQGQGIGKAVLSAVMDEHRRRGAEAFFLGATPAGVPLYRRLGYETVAEAQVWVRGETQQA